MSSYRAHAMMVELCPISTVKKMTVVCQSCWKVRQVNVEKRFMQSLESQRLRQLSLILSFLDHFVTDTAYTCFFFFFSLCTIRNTNQEIKFLRKQTPQRKRERNNGSWCRRRKGWWILTSSREGPTSRCWLLRYQLSFMAYMPPPLAFFSI